MWEFPRHFYFMLACCTNTDISNCLLISICPFPPLFFIKFFNGKRGNVIGRLPIRKPAIKFRRLTSTAFCDNTLTPWQNFLFCAFENFNWAVPLVQTAHGCRKQSVLYERQVGARTRSYSENWHTPQRRFTRSVESCTCTGRNGVTTPIGKPVFCFCCGRFSTTRVLTKTIGCCFGLPVKNGKQQQHQRKKNDCFTFRRLRDESTFTTWRHTDSSCWQAQVNELFIMYSFSLFMTALPRGFKGENKILVKIPGMFRVSPPRLIGVVIPISTG